MVGRNLLTYPGHTLSIFREIPHGTADENDSGGEVEIVEVFAGMDDVALTEPGDTPLMLENKQLVNTFHMKWLY